jgi:ribonuclease HII
MAYLIGTDEAGYGPNLGPLVVSATVWQIPDALAGRDLYHVLRDTVCSSAREASASHGRTGAKRNGSATANLGGNSAGNPAATIGRLVIADSKSLYRSRGDLAALESGVLAALAVLGRRPGNWPDIWPFLAPDAAPAMTAIAWYRDFTSPLPVSALPAAIEQLAARLDAGLCRQQVRLCGIRSAVLFPAEFNRLVDQCGSKGAVLSEQTIRLVAQLTVDLEEQPVFIQCDKHGGRNRYAALLQHVFPDHLVQVLEESRNCSRYRWGGKPRQFEVRFVVKGESFLPVALASMVSKYLRELAMNALNAYWCQRVPGLRPTAGYPGDARRFLAEIADCRRQLGIVDNVLWRSR